MKHDESPSTTGEEDRRSEIPFHFPYAESSEPHSFTWSTRTFFNAAHEQGWRNTHYIIPLSVELRPRKCVVARRYPFTSNAIKSVIRRPGTDMDDQDD
jgi:hypothetical protein